MSNKLLTRIHTGLIRALGRDRLEYLASNTMNALTQRVDPFIWSFECQAKIIEIRQETADTKTFVLLPNQHFKRPQPGQHIELSIDIAGQGDRLVRCYTLSEMDDTTVSITVKRSPKGRLSRWLHDSAQLGTSFDISQPRGRFVYRQQEKVLFICAGSGITPGYAVLRHMLAQPQLADIAFFYRTPTPELTIFQQPLAATGKVDFSYSRQGDADQTLAEQLAVYGDILERDIYLCGPEPFKNAVLKFLADIYYDFDRLELEQFAPPSAAASQARQLDEDVTVHLKSQNLSFVISAQNTQQTILEAAEAQGVEMPHGCRTGMCGSCRTNIVSGEVTGSQLGKTIYPCSAFAASRELVLQ